MGSRDSCSHFEPRGRASVELRWSGTVGILLVVRHRVVIPFVVALALVSVWGCGPKVAPLSRGVAPNLLLIVADDLGWGDVGCYGSPDARTPRLDAFANEGVRLTDFTVASPMCSPSRASLLSGLAPKRHGLLQALVQGNPDEGLDPSLPLLSEWLGGAGYATGLVGKWHLGLSEDRRPLARGFDRFFGMLSASSGYFQHRYRGTPDLWDGADPITRDGVYSTELFTEAAVEFVEDHRDQAWFLMLSYNAPHLSDDRSTIPSPSRFKSLFDGVDLSPERRDFLAATAAFDEGLGHVLDAIDRLDLRQDTLVVVLSDNGPLAPWGSAGPWKGGKDTLDEGGLRVPCVVRWPDRLPAGAVCDEAVTAMDLTATFLVAAGQEPADLDGVDVAATLAGDAPSPHEVLVWDHPSRRVGPDGQRIHDRVVRKGGWRLTVHQDGSSEIHLLLNDPGQQMDRSDDCGNLVAELSAYLSSSP